MSEALELILGLVLTALFLPAWELENWESAWWAKGRWVSVAAMLLCTLLELIGVAMIGQSLYLLLRPHLT